MSAADLLVSDLAGHVRYRPEYRFVRRIVSTKPNLYRFFAPLGGNDQVATASHDIVIDGFPRCANSTAEAAFLLSQAEGARVGHHCHAAAQILLGRRFNLPVVLLFRDPDAATLSMKDAVPDHISWRSLYADYVAMYRPIEALLPELALATFEDAIRRFDRIMQRVNDKFGTEFVVPDVGEAFDQAIARKRDAIARERTGRVPRYSNERDAEFIRQRGERWKILQAEQAALSTMPERAKAQRLFVLLAEEHAKQC